MFKFGTFRNRLKPAAKGRQPWSRHPPPLLRLQAAETWGDDEVPLPPVEGLRVHVPPPSPGHSLIKDPPFFKPIHELLAEFRWCREGAPGLVWRPGPRPAPLGRPGHIPGVPSRPKHPAQPLALSRRRGLAPRRPGGRERPFLCERQRLAPSNRPSLLTQPMRVRPWISRRACILRGSRTAGGPSRFETQGCAADGTADSPELWRAVTSAFM